MERFKILDLVMVDDDDVLIAGHARIEAAKPLGLSHNPAFRVTHLTAAEARAFSIASNRLAEMATWDRNCSTSVSRRSCSRCPIGSKDASRHPYCCWRHHAIRKPAR
jgi:hypothetical protein